MPHIGLYFGSFNPIHNGHIALAQYVLRECGFNEVWLMVSPNNPLKQSAGLWDENLRYSLAKEAVKDITGIRVSNFEFTLPRPSYTLDTLHALSAACPDTEFSLIIGSDNMAIFDQWKDYKSILQDYHVVVYPRKGDNLQVLAQKYPQMRLLPDAPLYDISSTGIRRLLKENKDVSRLTPVGDMLKSGTLLSDDY